MEDTNNVEQMTFGEKVKNFFIHPTKVFAQYQEKPTYIIRLLIICIVSAIYSTVQFAMSKPYMEKYINNITKGMDPQQADIVKKTMGIFSSTPVVVIEAIIGIIITIFIASLVYMLFIKMFKGKIKYGQVVSTYTTAYMAVVVGLIIKTIYMLISKKPLNISVQTNPTLLNTITASYDIFSIWEMVLMALGISTVAKISKKKGAIIVIIMFIILILITIGSFMLRKK
ncbi:Yip1 family protein [Clostridium pasteurianum]|uniref:Yip1 domain protein n=1 Tax=Clostridium pasteurianum BC1 TaxID=86416 RepID=R4K568_CLOPA|nr:Yip1 family protein [Clostridium pasteurianum]AGK95674.1 Yip1 domain protein [Clostridium pasteurianum BC1]